MPVKAVLLPRVCPPSQPGAVLKLRVTAEVEGYSQPRTQYIELTQLEPAHLYSLWLDGPPGLFVREILNQDNQLDLAPPLDREGRPHFDAALLSSHHYVISVDRRDLTLAPLAARDFAFALADLAQVRLWPADEQQALLTFVLGGGHLCLYDAQGDWLGLDLRTGVRPLGRGNLIAVGGGADQGRAAVKRWLEGELEELTLWLGGSSGGWRAGGLLNAGNLTDQLELLALLAPSEDRPDVISHRPGFLHPVWIYRETCRLGALEPWDYPEFNTAEPDFAAGNRNLRAIDDEDRRQLAPLQHCLIEARLWPPQLWLVVVGLPLMILLGGAIPRRRWLPPLLLLVALGAAGWLWWRAAPLAAPPLRVAVIDAEPQLGAAVERLALAARANRLGVLSLPLPADVLLRHLSWPPPGDWQLDADRHGAVWHGEHGGPLLTLAVEAPTQAPPTPVAIQTRRLDADTVELSIDTRRLAGRECYLLTPLGWLVLPAGQQAQRLELALPRITPWPGRPRLAAWERHLADWLPAAPRSQSITTRRGNQLLNYLARANQPLDPGADLPAARQAANRLAWLGLLQNPVGLRGTLSGQGVLFAPLGAETDAALPALTYLRLTFPLEPAP